MTAKLIHATTEEHILYIARVSSNQENADPGLIGYLIRNGHWSPFEMVSACVEIDTTRDIGRQILRHRSFSFQEFSGRYAEYSDLRSDRDIRFKGTTNRQGSRPAETDQEKHDLGNMQHAVIGLTRIASKLYRDMLAKGVAPECARAVLPEGLVPTRMYMHGTLRSWIHYIKERRKRDAKTGVYLAQLEHRKIATEIHDILALQFPSVFRAIDEIDYFELEEI